MNTTQAISMATSIKIPLLLPNKPNGQKNFRKNYFFFVSCKSTQVLKPNPSQSASISRRSGNYKPSLWDFDYVQSLKSPYSEEKYLLQASVMKMEVKNMLEVAKEELNELELIDDLQRLGISYHFEDIIKQMLTRIYEQNYSFKNDVPIMERDLYITSLGFRLLRQHGFRVSQEIFDGFKNDKGEFKASLQDDTKGLLQLYEASHLLTEGENTLEMARHFATISLDRNLEDVRSALELPLHWRVPKPNARSSINEYEKRPNMSPQLLEFAKIDFNIVQAKYQEELKQASRWWNETSLAEHLPFARDMLVVYYFWTIGGLAEPEYGYTRIMATKVNAFVAIIDDMYDIHGTLEELQLFTNIVQRWDIEALDQLPKYMQVCFLALNNFINEMAYDVLKDQGFVIIPYLRKSWIDLCKAFLQEAEWYSSGYKPSMEEYINNSWISISVPVILSHFFFLVANPIEKESVQSLYKDQNIIQWSATISRLANDLGTSPDEMKRGDVTKYNQCYMNETGADEKEAEEYVRRIMSETWKKMNKEIIEVQSLFPQNFITSSVNICRMAQYMYQTGGDGQGNEKVRLMIKRVSSLLFQPIV